MSNAGGEWTVLHLIDWTREFLARAGVEEPRLSAEILLARVLGCRRVELYARYGFVLGGGQLAAYRELIRRAAGHEPIAYIMGEKEFYSLALKVTPDVLVPRPETELLVDAALAFARGRRGAVRLWDACTGSGCVAVAAAHYAPAMSVLATDISEAALAVARENVERHGLAGRVRVERADLLALPEAGADMAPFDVIAANPPYVSDEEAAQLPEAVRREPDLAVRAGPTGLECIGRIVRDAPAHLRPGGLLAFEIGLNQAEKVHDLLRAAGCYEGVRFLKDNAGIERTALAHVKAEG